MAPRLEKQEKGKKPPRLSLGSLYRKKLDDFLEHVPDESVPLYGGGERISDAERAVQFRDMYNNFMEILRGFGNLTNTREKMGILSRIETVRGEAAYWTRRSDKGINFAHEINKAVKRNVSKRDWNEFATNSQKKYH